MKDNHLLSASLEDYIEAIYHIISEKEVARGKDIASRLKVSGASVTEALRALSKKGLINYAPYEVITMTDWPKDQVPPGAILNQADVSGKLARIPIFQGQVLQQEMLIDKEEMIAEVRKRMGGNH